MPLEAAMVVLDNSEYSRNGDLSPSRWDAQYQAVELYINVVVASNAESGMGLIFGGGKQVRLHLTPTNDAEKIISQFDKPRLEGNMNFSVAIQQAQLALKHRINKNQHQHIVAFVASPILDSVDVLVNLAKKLKKNNIAIDLINFGEQNEDHLKKLNTFFEAVQKGNQSKFLNIQPGQSATDVLFTAFSQQDNNDGQQPQDQNQQQQQQNQQQFLQFGGVDPNIDPELAMVLQMSMQEEQERQKKEQEQQQQQQPQQVQQQQQPQQQQQEQQVQQPQQAQQLEKIQEEQIENPIIEEENEEDKLLLEKAILLSMQEQQEEEQQQQQQQQQQQPQTNQNQQEQKKQSELFKNQEFLNDLLDGIEDEDEEDSLLKKDNNDKNNKKD